MNPPVPHGSATPASETIKQCCARLYESDLASRLLGDSFHPGGLRLTERLGEIAGLTPQSRVLDAAAGRGTSALFLAERFGCHVTGIDLSAVNVDLAAAEARRRDMADRVQVQCADAECLPCPDRSFDAIICECAFCTFPAKDSAASEFWRVLRPGGVIALSDITRVPGPPGELDDLMAWIACLGDARPAYEAMLAAAGFETVESETHDSALLDLARQIEGRLLAAEVLIALQKIDVPGVDFATAKRLLRSARSAIEHGRLGYAIVRGTRAQAVFPAVAVVST